MSAATQERQLHDELYQLQREAEWEKSGRSARMREVKAEIVAAAEGRKAEQQLVAAKLAEVLPEYSEALDLAIEAYKTWVNAMVRLHAASDERAQLLTRARKAEIEIPDAAFDSFARRQEDDYSLSLFHRERGIGVCNSGWPR